MISYQEALRVVRETAIGRQMPVEALAIEECLGRVAASDVMSPEAVPGFDNSAMDGFALASELTLKACVAQPVRLKVAGCIAAGDSGEISVEPGEAVEIMTGAPVPREWLDAVVKIEDVEVIRDSRGNAREIVLMRPLGKGENLRRRGEDFREGSPVIASGTVIAPEHIMALATLGVSRIGVRRRPKVAVISTGKELVHHSEPRLAPGMIRNSTGPFLVASLRSAGYDARFYDTVLDDPAKFEELMKGVLAEGPDAVISTGAVSMGIYDFVQESLIRLGARTIFHKVAIRPGKPLLFAEFSDGTVFFGVPGNPVSTAVGLRFFVGPYLRAVSGRSAEVPVRARLKAAVPKPEGLRCFFKAKIESSPAGVSVEVTPGQASFMVSPLLTANAWAVLPEAGTRMSEGAEIDVFTLREGL